MKTAADIVEGLRIGTDMHDTQQAQIMYEAALKDECWAVRAQALPLIVGCSPETWRDYLNEYEIFPQEEMLWHVIANDLSIEANAPIEIARIVEWARVQSVSLHPSFLRIYEFVRKVLLASSPAPESAATSTNDQVANAIAQEREIVLGAALSLVAKMPDKCRDEHGFADGNIIVDLMLKSAARWFPQGEPSMSAEEMARLIDKSLE